VFALLLALGTGSNAAGEALFLEMLKASSVIGKLAVKIHDRVTQVLWNCLSAVHADYYRIFFYVMSRDNYHRRLRSLTQAGPMKGVLSAMAMLPEVSPSVSC
jgi:hypothetical protein